MLLNKIFLFSLLFISLAICIAGRQGVSIEQVQFIFFPLILLHFILFPAKKLLQLPKILTISILFFAYFSALKTRGMLPSSFYSKYVYLVSDGEGEDRKFDRNFYNKFNQIAEHYRSRRMRMIFRDHLDPEDLTNLAKKFSEITFLFSSEPNQIFEVVFPKNIFKLDEIVIDDFLKKKAKKYDLDLEDKVSIIEIPELNLKLLLGQAPKILRVPAKPLELSADYLFWLQKAVAKIEPKGNFDKNFYQADKIALEEEAAGFLAEVNGAWTNPEPLAFAKLLLGTRMFLESSREGSIGDESSQEASNAIFRAVKSLHGEKNNDLMALARNNFAISRFVLANSSSDYENSIKELWKAIELADEGNDIPNGSKLAMLNMELIKEAGY